MTGKTIHVLLAEIRNWIGTVLVALLSQLDQLSKREEVRRAGVYLLAGPDPDDPSRALASIGEGDNVLRAAAPPEPERGQGLLGAHRCPSSIAVCAERLAHRDMTFPRRLPLASWSAGRHVGGGSSQS